MNNTYTITLRDKLLTHVPWRHLGWLHDADYTSLDHRKADAQVASGDYFATLATALDNVALGLPRSSTQRIELEQLIDNLLYLDKSYSVVPKTKQS